MKISTKVSIIAGLVMASVSGLSHAAPIDVYHQQINNVFAGSYFSNDRAWANIILDRVADAVNNNNQASINQLIGYYPNIQNASQPMRVQFTNILNAYVKAANDKPTPVTFSAGQSDGIAPLTAPDDTLSIPKSGKATGYTAVHTVNQTITPPANVSGAPFPVHPQNTAQTFAPTVGIAHPVNAAAPAYIAPVQPQTPAAPVINAPTPPDYAAIAAKAKDSAMSRANTIGGRLTSKAYQQEPNLAATHTFTTLPAATPDPVPTAPVVYNSKSQRLNDHSQAIANIQGGKATAAGYITPPAYTAPVPQPLPATPVVAPAAPVKVAPQKLTQGGGVWAMAPDIKGTDQGDSVIVIRNQNMVQAQRISTPIVVNPDVIGQPVSTNTITKPIALNPGQAPGGVAPAVDDTMPTLNTMDQGHNDPTGTPSTVVSRPNLSNSTPAAQDGVKGIPAHSTTTIVNQIAPAITVDKWGVNHTVETVDSSNVQNNATNAQDNATNKAATLASTPTTQNTPKANKRTTHNTGSPTFAPKGTTGAVPAGYAITPATQAANAAKAAASAPAPTPAPTAATPAAATPAPQQAQTQQAIDPQWQQQATAAVNSLIDAHNENVAVLNDHESRLGSLEAHDKAQDKRIADNNKKAMAGIAGALAQTGLHYTDSANSVAAGIGNYAGENAIAVGYSHQWGNSVRFSVQNSADTAHNFGASASVAVGW